MSQKIPFQLRKVVAQRAGFRCEYCRLPDTDSFYGFHVDHVISRKHGGLTVLENLAYACPHCNRNKGTDLGTFINHPAQLVRFFNPRSDAWNEHFEADETGGIFSKTEIGEATLKILEINHPDAVIERRALWQAGFLFDP